MGLALGLLAVMAGLLAASETAAQAVREGLALCGGSVIPALFPFLVVSRLFVATGSAAALGRLLALAGTAAFWQAVAFSSLRILGGFLLACALAAVLAMIPLSRSVFFGPMAVAIMGGLIVATVLTLLFLPALYAAWFRVKKDEARA